MTPSRDPVGRAFEVLAWLTDHAGQSWGVREVASGCELPAATVHRVLASLERLAIVSKVDGLYGIGLEMHRLAHRVAASVTVDSVARPFMRALVDDCDEQAYLVLFEPDRGEVMFSVTVEASHPLKYRLEQYRWEPLHPGASCLGVLAFADHDTLERLLSKPASAELVESLGGPDKARATLVGIVERGYARTRGRHTFGAVGLSAPVFDHRENAVANVLVTIPEHRYQSAKEPDLVEALLRCTAGISARLGSRRPALQEPATT